MAKYSYELKKEIVDAYLNGEGGYYFLSQKYGIPSNKDVRKWVNNYKAFGAESLMRSRKQEKYSFERKLHIVELYLSSEISYQTLAIQEGITNPGMIANWVNRFRADGPEGLRSHKKGRKKTLDKSRIEKNLQDIEDRTIDTSADHIKELEDELLKLRIENAFLKELRRLRLEDEAKMRERRSSSTASEESLS
jgi:transposase